MADPAGAIWYAGHRAILGEGPWWAADEGALYWIDIRGKLLIRQDPARPEAETRALPYRPTCVVKTRAGRLLVAYSKGIGTVDFATGATAQLGLDGIVFEGENFNDGACDPQGRLWIGTRDRDVTRPVGSLYSVAPNAGGGLHAARHATGFVISNGIAWSPDKRTLYHTDSRGPWIDAYDFDAGTLANRRRFLDYAGRDCHPDGCTVDVQGHLWVAEIGGGRVARYAPDATPVGTIGLPVSRPTSVMFGGPGLRTLFVTSMTLGLTEAELAAQPHAGHLLAIPVDVPGLPENLFAD